MNTILSPSAQRISVHETGGTPQLAAVNITRDTFHGDWNYNINPSQTKS
jgi:hypothetical protein